MGEMLSKKTMGGNTGISNDEIIDVIMVLRDLEAQGLLQDLFNYDDVKQAIEGTEVEELLQDHENYVTVMKNWDTVEQGEAVEESKVGILSMEDRISKALQRTYEVVRQALPRNTEDLRGHFLDLLDTHGDDKEAVEAFDKLPFDKQNELVNSVLGIDATNPLWVGQFARNQAKAHLRSWGTGNLVKTVYDASPRAQEAFSLLTPAFECSDWDGRTIDEFLKMIEEKAVREKKGEHSLVCPQCGSKNVKDAEKEVKANVESIPMKMCKDCGYTASADTFSREKETEKEMDKVLAEKLIALAEAIMGDMNPYEPEFIKCVKLVESAEKVNNLKVAFAQKKAELAQISADLDAAKAEELAAKAAENPEAAVQTARTAANESLAGKLVKLAEDIMAGDETELPTVGVNTDAIPVHPTVKDATAIANQVEKILGEEGLVCSVSIFPDFVAIEGLLNARDAEKAKEVLETAGIEFSAEEIDGSGTEIYIPVNESVDLANKLIALAEEIINEGNTDRQILNNEHVAVLGKEAWLYLSKKGKRPTEEQIINYVIQKLADEVGAKFYQIDRNKVVTVLGQSEIDGPSQTPVGESLKEGVIEIKPDAIYDMNGLLLEKGDTVELPGEAKYGPGARFEVKSFEEGLGDDNKTVRLVKVKAPDGAELTVRAGKVSKANMQEHKPDEKQLKEMYKKRLHAVYDSFEEFKEYDDVYGLSKRLGYASAEEAWEANPVVQGSTNPSDYKKVKEDTSRKELAERLVKLAEDIADDKGTDWKAFIEKAREEAAEYFNRMKISPTGEELDEYVIEAMANTMGMDYSYAEEVFDSVMAEEGSVAESKEGK